MSSSWYPIVDEEKCVGCKACFNKCSRGVYVWENERPKVANPVGCCQGCHGCGNLCLVGAISYFGENGTGTSCCK